MDVNFVNKYIEILNNEIIKNMRDKMLLQTNYELSLNKIKELEKSISELDETVKALKEKNSLSKKKPVIKEVNTNF